MKQIAPSELIINGDGSVFHLHLRPEQIADTIILVGDQGRVPMVAAYFDEGSVECNVQSREFATVTGRFHGKRISVISTGIGTDNIDIVMNELDALANIDFATRTVNETHRTLTILRIGTCGCVRSDIPLGGYIFTEVAAGCDGLLNWYGDVEKISDLEMEQAFMECIGWNSRLSTPYFVHSDKALSEVFADFYHGITMSAQGFYGPQGRTLRVPLTFPDYIQRLESFSFRGLRMTNIEMEASAINGLGALLGHRTGTVCLAIANRYIQDSNPDYKQLMSNMIEQVLQKLAA